MHHAHGVDVYNYGNRGINMEHFIFIYFCFLFVLWHVLVGEYGMDEILLAVLFVVLTAVVANVAGFRG